MTWKQYRSVHISHPVIWSLCILLVSTINGYQVLPVTSCLSGDYSSINDVNCTNAIDGDLTTSYQPKLDSGWLTVDLEIVSMVTAVDVMFARGIGAHFTKNVRLRIVFSDKKEYVIHTSHPRGLPENFYRQRVLFTKPHITKSVTVSWSSRQLAPISDVTVVGTKQGIEAVNVTSLSTTKCPPGGSACVAAYDGDLRTSFHLLRDDRLKLELDRQGGANMALLALYSAPLLPEANQVPLQITARDDHAGTEELAEMSYTNQGSDREVTWQTVTIETSAVNMSLSVSRDYITISELEVYTVDMDIPWTPVNVDEVSYAMASSGDYAIIDMETVVIGDVYTDPPTLGQDVMPFVTTLLPDSTERTALVIDIGTSAENNTSRAMEVSLPEDITTTQSLVTFNDNVNSTEATMTPWFSFWSLSWYWYVLIGTGAFMMILVIVIIILLARLRSKTYRPRNPRPRVVLRSLSSVGDGADAFSVVTPTRGYYHLTMNSQSSMPLPYTAFSPVNTSTFSRKEAQQGFGFNNDIRQKSTDSDKYNAPIHDGELSDDCFI